jgi:hypothetical protein
VTSAHPVALERCWSGGASVFFERNHLEWHTKDFNNFFGELAIIGDVVAGTPQTTSHHLLEQQLRHKKVEANNMRHE